MKRRARNTKPLLLAALRLVSPEIQRHAICSQVEGVCYEFYSGRESANVFALLRKMFQAWPQYSGNPCYPVPSPDGPVTAYSSANLRGTLWQGEYGRLRVDLLKWLIQELEGGAR